MFLSLFLHIYIHIPVYPTAYFMKIRNKYTDLFLWSWEMQLPSWAYRSAFILSGMQNASMLI